jgi:hypothetical protein
MKYFYILIMLFLASPCLAQIQGDCDCNGDVDIADVSVLIGYIFQHQSMPPCIKSDSTSVTIYWTVPGIPGQVTNAIAYNLKFAPFMITADNWNWARQVSVQPLPVGKIAGSQQSYKVTGLSPATTYFFAMQYQTSTAWSSISNVAIGTTLGAPQNNLKKIEDLER